MLRWRRTDLALIHNAPVGVHGPDLAVGVHAAGHGGREQPEAHAAAQQDVQGVVVLMVQAGEGPCNKSQLSVHIRTNGVLNAKGVRDLCPETFEDHHSSLPSTGGILFMYQGRP